MLLYVMPLLPSGVGYRESTVPLQVMSPNVEVSPTEANVQPSGSVSLDTSRVKDEPQSRSEHEERKEARVDTKLPTPDVKDEREEPERKEENDATPVKQEEHTPEPDSEDSITAERVAEELQHLSGTRAPRNRRGSPCPTVNSKGKSYRSREYSGASLWPICFARSRKT